MKTEILVLMAAIVLALPADAARVAYVKPKAPTYCAVCAWQAQQAAVAAAQASTTYIEPPAVTSPVIEGGQVVGQ